MAEIADFSSSPTGPPWQALVRPLTPADVPVVAGFHAAREGVAVSRAEQVVRGWCSETTRHVLVDLTDEVWCVVNARNRPSLDLHADLGFVEQRRGPRLTGVEFTGGLGLLVRRTF